MEPTPAEPMGSLLVFEPEEPLPQESPARQVAPSVIDPLKLALFPVRAFLALGWLRASAEKAISLDWWRGVELRSYLDEQATEALPFMAPISEHLFHPLALPIAIVVMLGQFMIGVCFATAQNLRPAIYAALTLNLTFVAMGSVTPSAFYLAIQLSLLLAVARHRQVPQESQQHHPPKVGRTWRRARIGVVVVASLALLPFVRTLHPADVIHDPALILITIGLLAACCDALHGLAASPGQDSGRGTERRSAKEVAVADTAKL